MLMDRLPCEL